jgi:polyhydroxybutyrate depolymerase
LEKTVFPISLLSEKKEALGLFHKSICFKGVQMKKILVGLVFYLVLCLALKAEVLKDECLNPSAGFGTGSISAGSLAFDNQLRTYNVYVPQTYYQKKSKVSLVLALHGHGSDSGLTMRGFLLEPIADREGFIIVYPDGLLPPVQGEPGYNPNWARGWNAGHCCGFANITNVDDSGFLEQLVRLLQQEFRLDEKRTYIIGASNGGMMAYRFAAERPQMAAAIAPILATLGGLSDGDRKFWHAPKPGWPIPIIVFNCVLDEVVAYYGNEEHISAMESVAFWAENNLCSSKPTETLSSGGDYILRSYTCPDQSEVEFYSMLYEGHTWPYRPLTPSSMKTEEVAARVWDFFSKHPLLPAPLAPTDFKAERIVNSSVFSEQNNVKLSWSNAPDEGFKSQECLVFVEEDDGPWSLLATLPMIASSESQRLSSSTNHVFWHRGVKKGSRYSYMLYSITTEGYESKRTYAAVEPSN